MPVEIEVITTTVMALALDAASLRHQAIATNIANANTLGYVPKRLNFDAQLSEARRALQMQGSIDPQTLAFMRLELEPVLQANGQPATVQLDTEMADMAQNTVQYQALIKGLSRHMALLSAAVNDGKK